MESTEEETTSERPAKRTLREVITAFIIYDLIICALGFWILGLEGMASIGCLVIDKDVCEEIEPLSWDLFRTKLSETIYGND